MTAAHASAVVAGCALLAVAVTVAGSILAPTSAFVLAALISMGALAGAVHAIGRTHPGP